MATKPVDFRKGHDGLAALAERELGLDPHSGIIVVFRAKRGDRIKVLLLALMPRGCPHRPSHG